MIFVKRLSDVLGASESSDDIGAVWFPSRFSAELFYASFRRVLVNFVYLHALTLAVLLLVKTEVSDLLQKTTSSKF